MTNDNINLEWYVLNEVGYHTEFDKYPYCTSDTNIKPYNVFNNWLFREDAIKLAKKCLKGDLNFEEFKEELLKSLMWQEWGRCEYEILVANWPSKVDARGEIVCDKIDCYIQVLPNANIFAEYVLNTVRMYTRGKVK